jgi:translation initiation factor 1
MTLLKPKELEKMSEKERREKLNSLKLELTKANVTANKNTAKSLKEKLACGGTVKDNTIELQGDHKKQAKEALIKLGFPEGSISD